MKRITTLVIALGLALANADLLHAYPPTYRLLRTPHSHARHTPSHVYHLGNGQRVQRSTYYYGWFGAAPRRHWTSHYGYYQQYREWSAR